MIRLTTILLLIALQSWAMAQTAHFLIDGRFQTIGDEDAQPLSSRAPRGVSELFGALADGRLVVGVGEADTDHTHGEAHGLSLGLLDGDDVTIIADDVIRAYPAPVGSSILFINTARDSLLWTGASVVALPIDRRASQFAWFPDASAAAVTCFDPDWTVHQQNNADTYEDFLRMNNNDIYLLSMESFELTPLVVHPEADWSPAISPDGTQMVFNSTRLNSRASIFAMNLNSGELTPLSVPDPEAGYEGNLPVSLVNQVVWRGDQLIYATCRPDYEHEIRTVNTEGSARASLGRGFRPQLIGGGASVAFQTDDGEVATATLAGGE